VDRVTETETEWQSSLESVVASGHPVLQWRRYGVETADEGSRLADRQLDIRLLSGQIPQSATPPTYPPLWVQAGNVLRAIGRLLANVISGQLIFVPREERERRLAICHGCPRFDAARDRCIACGCIATLKSRLESEEGFCPDGRWYMDDQI
jgi:hypothetical protein